MEKCAFLGIINWHWLFSVKKCSTSIQCAQEAILLPGIVIIILNETSMCCITMI
jgi:hypothetical protein